MEVVHGHFRLNLFFTGSEMAVGNQLLVMPYRHQLDWRVEQRQGMSQIELYPIKLGLPLKEMEYIIQIQYHLKGFITIQLNLALQYHYS